MGPRVYGRFRPAAVVEGCGNHKVLRSMKKATSRIPIRISHELALYSRNSGC